MTTILPKDRRARFDVMTPVRHRSAAKNMLMNFILVILGFVIFSLTCEVLPGLIFDLDYLFPIIVGENQININTVIIYSVFTVMVYGSWVFYQTEIIYNLFVGYQLFNPELWILFMLFWMRVALFAFFLKLVVEQVRWNFI
jgi:hypothetical protein